MSCGAVGTQRQQSPPTGGGRAAVAHASLRSGSGAGCGPRVRLWPLWSELPQPCPVSTSLLEGRCLPPVGPSAQRHLEVTGRGPETLGLLLAPALGPGADPIAGSCYDVRGPTVSAAGSGPEPMSCTHSGLLWWPPAPASVGHPGGAPGRALWGRQGRWYLRSGSWRVDRNTCASEEFRPWLDTVSVTRNWS